MITPYLRAIVTYVLTRLQSKTSKSTGQLVHDKFTRDMLLWICLFLALDKQPGGPNAVIDAFDALQPGLVIHATQCTIQQDNRLTKVK